MTALLTPAELPKWVPGQLLASSEGLGWHDVELRDWRYRGMDVAVPGLRDFVVIAYNHGATDMQRRFEGHWTKARCGPGDISLLTRSQASHWHWTQDLEVSHVYLAERLVSRVAEELAERSVAEVRLSDVLRAEDAALTALAQAIRREACARLPGSALVVEALGVQLAVHLLRYYAAVRLPEPRDEGRLTPAQARRVAELIEARLHEPLGLEALAQAAGLGVWSFAKRFRRSFGLPPHRYVIERRVERAEGLLREGRLPLKQVAAACGFADQAHMTRLLRSRRQTTPAAVRRGAVASH